MPHDAHDMHLEPEMPVRRKRGPQPGTEAARRGGRAAAEKYGSEFYRQIGKKGGAEAKARYGSEHFARIGRRGGETTRARLGLDHYARIGKIGGEHHGLSRQEAKERSSRTDHQPHAD
jgi:general stress protein YciG